MQFFRVLVMENEQDGFCKYTAPMTSFLLNEAHENQLFSESVSQGRENEGCMSLGRKKQINHNIHQYYCCIIEHKLSFIHVELLGCVEISSHKYSSVDW